MTKIASSDTLGPQLLEALGVPWSNCRRAEIVFEPQEPVRVHATYWAEEPEKEIFPTFTKTFKVVEE